MAQTCCASLWTKAEFSSRRVLPLILLLLAVNRYAEGVALDAVSFQLPAPPPLTGALASNNVLLDAEQIHTGQVGTPHSYTAYGDNMYAVTDRGQVVNVAPCRPVVVANLRTRGCQSAKECGHLVSIRLSPDNLLLVLDAYQGLFEVHPYSGVVRLLYDAKTLVNGRPSVYLNDFAFLNDGTLVFSDASPTFDYDNEFWIRFEGRPDGRLLTYNSTSGQAKEILAGISYPTGVELTDDGRTLLVSEAGRARILRISLSKDKFLQRSYFSENLPGMPEHIRKSGRGTYWVGLSYPRYRGEVSITDQYSSKPTSRNFLAVRRTKEQLQLMYAKRGLAIEVDGSGKILRSFHDPTGLKIAEVLELVEYSAVLYVGTRAQSSTVRIVGSPNSLTVDSLVQVLRGRCQVAEDRIQESKVSLEQQLKARKDTATNDQGFSGTQPSKAQSMGPGDYNSPPLRRVNISQGLSELHRTLIRAPQRHMQTYQPSRGYESVPNYGPPYKPEAHNLAPPYQPGLNMAPSYQHHPNVPPPYQPAGHSIPAGPQRPGRPNQPNRNPPPHQKPFGFDDPFLPVNGPQIDISLQRANRVPSGLPAQQNGGSPNQPRVVHSLHKGELVSHVILSKKAEEALAGNLLSPQVSPSQNENLASSPPVRAQNTTLTPQRQVVAMPQQKPSEDIGALGGFLGFIDSNARAGTPTGNENLQPKQSPIVPIAMPDQNAPGHLEPLHSIISPLAHQTDQQSQSGASFPGLELFTGSQDVARRNYISANRPRPAGSSSSLGPSGTSFAGNGQKQYGSDVVDMPNVIQSIQMFHPTDRPDNSPQSQNNAGVKLGSTFQQKASLLKQGLRQLHQIFQESPPTGQSLIPGQKESRSKAQEVTPFDPVEAGLSLVQRTSNGNAATSVTNQQTKGIINVNNEHLTKQPLTPFSRAAAIHRNQPTNNIFDKRFSVNTQTRIGAMQGGVVNTNSPMQASHGQFPKNISSGIHTNDSQSSTDVTSGAQTNRSHPSLLSAPPVSSHDTRQNMTQAMQESYSPRPPAASYAGAEEHAQQPSSTGKTSPTGYIQVYQSPGQYILIPLTQASLIQALRGLSAEQVKRVQIVKTNTGASEQTTAANKQPASSTLPTDAKAPQMNQEYNLTQLQAQRQEVPNQQGQEMPNQPSHEFLPGKGQIQSQNSSHTSAQDRGIQDAHQQNQQQMHQGGRFVQYEQTQPQPSWPPMATLQRQQSEHNAERTPFTNANFRQEQQERLSSSNGEQSPASTPSVNSNATSPPKWFTLNSDQKNAQSTQQFTQTSQQITQPAQQGTQLTQEFPQPTQQFAHSTSQFSQPTQQFVQSTSQFSQPKQQFVQSTSQFSQPTQQFAHSTSQVSQPTQQLARATSQFSQPTQQLAQPISQFYQTTQQFAQSTNQFSQPAQQFNQQTQQFAQSTQHLSQPARQLTQSTHQFTQPTQLYTQPTQQFTQQDNRIPTGYATSSIAQQSTQNFNTQPAPTYIQQPTQEYNKYPTHQSSHNVGNFSVSRITKFPTQHRIQSFSQPITPYNQQKPQGTGWQQTDHNTQDITLHSHNQTINRAFTQEQLQQAVVWQAPHFTQHSQQDSIQEFSQQKPTSLLSSNQSVHLSQQIINQPRQPIKDSAQESRQMFTEKIGQNPSQYSTQGVQLFTQLPVNQLNKNSRQHLTQPPIQMSSQLQTQQSPTQFSQSVGQFTEQPTDGFNQISFQNTAHQLNSHITPNVTQQFPNHLTQQFLEQPLRQPSQQLNNELSRQESQQPVQQSSQQFNSYLTPHNSGQPAEQKSQQFSNHEPSQHTEQPLQQTTQQLNSHSTLHNLEQPVQISSQQFNSYSMPHSLDQPAQKSSQQFNSYSIPHNLDQPTQTSPQQFNSYSTPHNLDQPVQTSSQLLTSNPSPNMSFPPAPPNSQQLASQLKSQDLEQPIPRPTHQLNPYLTHHTSEQPNQQPQQQTVLHPTTHQSQPTEDIQTKLIHRITPLFTHPPTQQSLQYSNYPSSQQLTQQRFSSQSFQHLTQQSTQEPKPTDPNNDRSHNMPRPSQFPQHHNDEPTLVTQPSQMSYSSQSFVPQLIQPSQQSSQSSTQYQTRPPSPQVPRQSVNTSVQQPQSATQQHTDYATQFIHKPTQLAPQQTPQETSQKTMAPTQNFNIDTAPHFTYQPTQQFAQPSSQHPANGKEDRSTYFTQQTSQKTSQQTMEATQNYNTAQQTSQQTRQFSQPSSQHPTMGTEDHSTRFAQQKSQQTSQQTMEPTQNYKTDTAQHFTYQPTQLFSQPSSQHPSIRTEERSPQFTQQASQQTSQQISQQTSQQTRQFAQPSSRRPSMGTEERSPQFTQQVSQQTSQQLHQQTILQSTQMSEQTTRGSVSKDISHYLTRTPPQRTTQTREEIIELPNELFTPQPTQDVELQPSKPVPRQ